MTKARWNGNAVSSTVQAWPVNDARYVKPAAATERLMSSDASLLE